MMTIEEIIERQDEIAAMFESDDFVQDVDVSKAAALDTLWHAAQARRDAEAAVTNAVAAAREAGASWPSIGTAIGTTGQSARERYSVRARARRRAAA